jgi:hypothetical protein
VTACFSNPNVNSNSNNPLPTRASYHNNRNVDNLQPLHEGGGLGNLDSVTIDEQTIATMHLEGL